jgi:hypothetical protein
MALFKCPPVTPSPQWNYTAVLSLSSARFFQGDTLVVATEKLQRDVSPATN